MQTGANWRRRSWQILASIRRDGAGLAATGAEDMPMSGRISGCVYVDDDLSGRTPRRWYCPDFGSPAGSLRGAMPPSGRACARGRCCRCPGWSPIRAPMPSGSWRRRARWQGSTRERAARSRPAPVTGRGRTISGLIVPLRFDRWSPRGGGGWVDRQQHVQPRVGLSGHAPPPRAATIVASVGAGRGR